VPCPLFWVGMAPTHGLMLKELEPILNPAESK
jgi:hypothetical protein